MGQITKQITSITLTQNDYDQLTPMDGVLYMIDNGDGVEKIINGTEKVVSNEKVILTTYAELKNLRDHAQLVPGQQYRITDYECTTSQPDTRSAGHQFDIIVTAIDESHLSEDAKAARHWIDCIVLSETEGDLLMLRRKDLDDENGYAWCYAGTYFGEFNPNNLMENLDMFSSTIETYTTKSNIIAFTQYDTPNVDDIANIRGNDLEIVYAGQIQETYFENCNLDAWQIWYIIDNNQDRFCCAVPENSKFITYVNTITGDVRKVFYNFHHQDGDKYWYGSNIDYTALSNNVYTVEEATVGSTLNLTDDIGLSCGSVDTIGYESGKGVIYRMIDEFNNDCPYDFKNIQFKRYKCVDYLYYSYNDSNWHRSGTIYNYLNDLNLINNYILPCALPRTAEYAGLDYPVFGEDALLVIGGENPSRFFYTFESYESAYIGLDRSVLSQAISYTYVYKNNFIKGNYSEFVEKDLSRGIAKSNESLLLNNTIICVF